MRYPFLISLSLACGTALAADVPGSQDLQSLPRFPRAEIVDYRDVANEERRYPQDGLRRISGQLRVSQEVIAEAMLLFVVPTSVALPVQNASKFAFPEPSVLPPSGSPVPSPWRSLPHSTMPFQIASSAPR